MFTNQPKFFWASAALIIALATTNNLLAQNRSRIGGNIRDAETGEPLIGVNVMIEGTVLGAATDPDGNYIIINVPVGTHRVKATMIGYESKILTDVMVSADRITHLDFSLRHTVIQGEEVIVTAQRDELHKEVSNTQLVVDAMQISDATGIREINSFLTKLPGVGEDNGFLTIRGGSADQTGVMVNGLSFVNSATGNAETSIPLSAVEQVSLLSGGYNAEYGNFRSGLINVTTKTGLRVVITELLLFPATMLIFAASEILSTIPTTIFCVLTSIRKSLLSERPRPGKMKPMPATSIRPLAAGFLRLISITSAKLKKIGPPLWIITCWPAGCS
jgi:hypothetical protein